MLHAGLDLSRRKVDVCLLNDHGEQLDQFAVAPDLDSLRTLARRVDDVHAEPVCADSARSILATRTSSQRLR